MRILSRYVLGRLVAPFGFALAALTGFMLLNQIAKRFDLLTGKGLGANVITEVFALSLPFILALTIPMAVLVAVLFAFSHLAADSEITAMRASGVSIAQLVGPVVAATLLMACFTFVFVDQALPRSNARLRTLFWDIARKRPTFQLHEQVVNPIPSSDYFLRAATIDQNRGVLRNVAIYDLGGQWSRRVIYADSGQMALTGGGSDLLLELHNGSVHEFPSSAPQDFRLVHFQRNLVILRNVYDELSRNKGDVIRGDREMSTCEMLGVVRGAERNRDQALADRRALLLRDLRTLLDLGGGLPTETIEERPLAGYCAWFERLGKAVLPKTAEAMPLAHATMTQSERSVKPPKPADARQLKLQRSAPAVTGPELVSPPGAVYRASPSAHTLATWSEVSGAIARTDDATRSANRFEVEVHKKWVIAFAAIPFALVAVVLALRFPRGGMGLVIGGAMAVFSVFWVGLTAGEALADKGYIAPWMAMWSPIIILSAIGIVGLLFVSREMGSTRGGDWNEISSWVRERLRVPGRRRA